MHAMNEWMCPNSISKELAEKIRDKYFPKKDTAVKRAVKVVKKAARPSVEENPMETHSSTEIAEAEITADDEFGNVTISRQQFEMLSAKTKQILIEAALAQDRIAEDQREIDILKTETREILKRLRAA